MAGSLGTHERRLMESESRWLQKALFALAKADDDREKLTDALDGDVQELLVTIDGTSFEFESVRSAMTDAVNERAERLRSALNKARSMAR